MGRGGPAVDDQLVVDRSEMGVYGTFTQHESVSDLRVAQPIGHQMQDLDFRAVRPADLR
jgi:hypothetical protein